jgi:cytochrome c peroxidase
MRLAHLACAAALAAVVGGVARVPAQAGYTWTLPPGFPPPPVPADNPMSDAKVALGRHLFYDTRLSTNGTQSCATCHQQARAFTDGRPRSVGSTGQIHPRGSMSLVNVAYARALTWGDPTQTRLEEQALVPMYGEHPVELGLTREDRWLDLLKAEPRYYALFDAAFGDHVASFTRANVLKALAAFQRAIVSARAPYDRYHFERDDSAVSAAARRGEVLFFSRPMSCFTCHGGPNFSNAMGASPGGGPVPFNNTGLYNIAGQFSYPPGSTGVHETTRDPKDVGRFKAPSLRNIAVTAPYMHDGSVATLEDVLAHYAAGGRTIADGPHRGVGRDNPNKNPSIRGFELTAAQRADVIAFLESLTDADVLRDPKFGNPWR